MKKLIIILLLLPVFSCENALDVPLKSNIETDLFFKTEADFELALNGVYDVMGNHQDGGGFGSYFRGLMIMGRAGTDEGYIFPLFGQYGIELSNYTYTPQSLVPTNVWEMQYRGIARANTLLSRLDSAVDLDIEEEDRNRIIGEAKFLRAFYYFQLVRFFGEVPIVTQEIKDVSEIKDADFQRKSIPEVYAQIIKDLMGNDKYDPTNPTKKDIGAEDLLPENNDNGRAEKYAAMALLSKVYLQMSGFPMLNINAALANKSATDAADYAKFVIDEGGYELLPKYEDVFKLENEYSKEYIFSVQYSFCGICEGGQVGTWDGPPGLFTYSQTYSIFRTFKEHYESFKSDDLRRDYNVVNYQVDGFDENGNQTTRPIIDGNFYAFKWRHAPNPADRPGGSGAFEWQSPFDFPLTRYADILLTYAEAQFRAGGDTGDGLKYLNMVRRRGYGKPVNTLDSNVDLTTYDLDDILDERRWELCYEGHRWHDLVRHGKLLDAVRSINSPESLEDSQAATYIQDRHIFFPVPQREIQAGGLTQNPGW